MSSRDDDDLYNTLSATSSGPPLDEIECPRCAERIKARAKACRFCGYDLLARHYERDHRQRRGILWPSRFAPAGCRICGGHVAPYARLCVHCGADWPTRLPVYFLIPIVLILVFWAVLSASGERLPWEPRTRAEFDAPRNPESRIPRGDERARISGGPSRASRASP